MSSILLLAAPGRSAVRQSRVGITIFKVADWDPKRHPRGYKGMFIETPDKKQAENAQVGDVIATKSGKVFQVTGHGNKGIKVQSVDPDTGEVQDKGTVVANAIEVAIFQPQGSGGPPAGATATPKSVLLPPAVQAVKDLLAPNYPQSDGYPPDPIKTDKLPNGMWRITDGDGGVRDMLESGGGITRAAAPGKLPDQNSRDTFLEDKLAKHLSGGAAPTNSLQTPTPVPAVTSKSPSVGLGDYTIHLGGVTFETESEIADEIDGGTPWTGRSKAGRLRNFKDMGDAKLVDVIEKIRDEGRDPSAEESALVEARNRVQVGRLAPAGGARVTPLVGIGKTTAPVPVVGTLTPGTYIKHPRSGKRFQVGKQGKWTTVYPVDARGERTGKHTVLPPLTEVVIEPKEVASNGVTPAAAQAFPSPSPAPNRPSGRSSLRSRTKTVPAAPTKPADVPLTKGGDFKEGDILRGIVATEGVDVGELYTVRSVDNGLPVVTGGMFTNPTAVRPTLLTMEKSVEVMPKIEKPPRTYAPGVGKGTAVYIEEMREIDPAAYRQVSKKATYRLVRRPEGQATGGDVVGEYNSVGAARKAARGTAENHEAIYEQRGVLGDWQRDLKPGDWVIQNATLKRVDALEHRTNVYGPYTMATFPDGQSTILKDGRSLPVPDIQAFRGAYRDKHGVDPDTGTTLFQDADLMQLALAQSLKDPSAIRAARPNLYVKQLQSDYDPSELVGLSKGEALAALRKAGYAEITPREPNMTKYVNARGTRLHLRNKNGQITAVDEIKSTPTAAAGGVREFHDQLKTVLDSGGDVRALNPQADPNVEARTAVTKQLVFDMALGKQNGVEKIFQTSTGSIKVKSDAKYRTEITADPSAKKRDDFADSVDDPGLNVPLRTEVMDKHFPDWKSQPGIAWTGNNLHILQVPPDADADFAAVAIAAGERNGFASWMKEQYPADTFKESVSQMAADYVIDQRDPSTGPWAAWTPGQRQYVIDTLTDVDTRGRRQWDLRKTETDRRIDSAYEQWVADETVKRRKIEGTVATAPGVSNTFELPLWEDIDLQEQDLGDVESLIQNAPNAAQIVPFFLTGGLLKDGVAYGVKDASAGRSGYRIDARVDLLHNDTVHERLMGAGARDTANSRFPDPHGSSGNQINRGTMLKLDDGGDKRIEYVYHSIPGTSRGGQSTPANQRGMVRMFGYTPEEAAARLKDLGIAHDAADSVPYTSIMRSRRRYGRVLPLHSDYVSGDVPLPQIPAAIVHGMASSNIKPVFDSGGLLPIAERFRVGIPLTGSIPRNDVSAGVDHVVFAAISHTSSPYGDVNVVYKDSAFLRRDVLLTDRVFSAVPGQGSGRYPAYRKYQNDRRKEAGISGADADVNPYVPMEPSSRQAHINDRYLTTRGSSYEGQGAGGNADKLGPSQNEWDVEGGMPIEDMATVYVPDARYKTQLDAQLDQMLRQGRISERPDVEVSAGRYSGDPLPAAKRSGFTRTDPKTIGKR